LTGFGSILLLITKIYGINREKGPLKSYLDPLYSLSRHLGTERGQKPTITKVIDFEGLKK